jgi:hypothetical protein
MKKGDFVKVKENADYSGQDMAWTEEKTGKNTYGKGHVFYHFSDSKLNGFYPKTTCFYDEEKTIPGHCYAYILDRDINIETYCNEVRLNLKETDNLIYLGKVTYERDYTKKEKQYDSCGRFQGWGPVVTIKDNRIKLG